MSRTRRPPDASGSTLPGIEEHYRSVFKNMLNGLAYCKVLTDTPPPHDFVYLEVNDAFETLTGLKGVVGTRASEVIPGIREQDPWVLALYSEVAETGQPRKLERYVKALGEWFRATQIPVVFLDMPSPEGGTLDGIIGMNLFLEFNLIVRGGGLFLADDPTLELQRIGSTAQE